MQVGQAPVQLPDFLTPFQLLAVNCGLAEHELRDLLRRLIRERLETEGERVAIPCGVCGDPVEVAYAVARKVRAGTVPKPRCRGCRWPAVEKRAGEEAVAWVELLGDSAEELAAAVAALRCLPSISPTSWSRGCTGDTQ